MKSLNRVSRLSPGQIIFATIILFLLRARASGIELLQDACQRNHGKVLVTANHVSFLDGVLIALSSPVKMIYAVEFEYSVRNPRTSALLNCLSKMGFGEIVPLDMQSRYGIRRLRHALLQGIPVMIFPEGRIGTGAPQPEMPGVRWLLTQTQAVEFKINIAGAETSRFFGKAGTKFWPPIHLAFGQSPESLR